MPGRIRVLLVDSDVRTARVVARLLHEDGFDVELADGSQAAVRLSSAPLPDVLIADYAAAEPSSLAVARRARVCDPALPICLVTERPELARGAVRALDPEPRIFTKPLDYAALRQALAGMVNRRPALREGLGAVP